MHEGEILHKTDTIGVIKIVKAALRLTYDVEGLFAVSAIAVYKKDTSFGRPNSVFLVSLSRFESVPFAVPPSSETKRVSCSFARQVDKTRSPQKCSYEFRKLGELNR